MPKLTVQEFFQRFPDDDTCLEHVMEVRYGLLILSDRARWRSEPWLNENPPECPPWVENRPSSSAPISNRDSTRRGG